MISLPEREFCFIFANGLEQCFDMRKFGKTIVFAAVAALFVCCGKGEKPVDLEKLSSSEQIALLDAKIRKEPQNDELFYLRGKALLESGNAAEALQDAQKAISLNKKNAQYYVLQADILFVQGENSLAFDALQKATAVDGECIEAYLKSAELSLYLKDYDKVLFNVKQAMLLDKNEPKAYFLRGWAMKEQGDTAKAVVDYRKAVELKGDYEQAYEELGNLYAIKGDPLAIEYLRSVLNINPKNIQAMYTLALFYQEHDAWQQALEIYQQLLEIKPDHADAMYNVGYINYEYKQDYISAVECFTGAIKADSAFWQAYDSRAKSYEKQGENAKAAEDYAKAEELQSR